MSDNNDIVKRLQAIECSDAFSRNLLNKACEEIERLRKERDEARREMCGMGALCAEAADEIQRLRELLGNPEQLRVERSEEIERLRKERDEARRSVCEMSIQFGGVFRRVGGKTVEVTTPQGCAEIMRWDCFKEARDER